MANRDKIEKLEDLIKDSIEGELIEQKATSLLPPGENYGSVMYKVDFKVKNGDKIKEYHAVAKCTPLNQVTQEVFNIQKTFKSEIAWYTTVIPTLKKFAKEHGLERDIDFFQEFYGARISLDPNSTTVDLDGVILTENLKYRGYKTIDRHIGFDTPTTRSILRDMATFHATSLALRYFNLDKFTQNIRPYLSAWVSSGDEENQFKKIIFPVYEHLPETKHLMNSITKMVENSNMYGERELREPWITTIHMDFWSNNVMVTLEANPKTILLDWQCPGLGSPAADVVFFLLTSTKYNAMDDSFDDLIDFYYKNFTNDLKQLKVPLDQFSLEAFKKEVDREAVGGEISHALSHVQITQGEKGVSMMDAGDEDCKDASFIVDPSLINERHIARFRWVTKEAEKHRWI